MLVPVLLLVASAAALEVRVEPAEARPGDVLAVTVLGAGAGDDVRLSFRGRDYPLFPAGDGRRGAFIGLSAEAAPGRDPVRAALKRRFRRDLEAAAAVSVSTRAFPSRALRMPRSRARLAADPANRDAVARIRAVAAVATPRLLWDGPLAPPAPGRVSAAYGQRRTINGRPWSWHKGVDIAAPAGTPVTAPAAGVVALAGVYPAQGGTVVIDHGWGLMSALFHLGTPSVRAGDEVARSSPVAAVGGSGVSTGAHVHWGVYLHGAPVDPEALTRRGP